MQYLPHQVAITRHENLTVQFYDVSPQLLVGIRPQPIVDDFPKLLPRLTIDMNLWLSDPAMLETRADLKAGFIADVQFAAESLECCVVLSNGYTFLFRLTSISNNLLKSDDKELILFHPMGDTEITYSPFFCLAAPARGSVTASALNDIGGESPHISFRSC
jgi:syntaxin-binding protein 5